MSTALLWGEQTLSSLVAHLSTSGVLLEHTDEGHGFRVDRFEHGLEILCAGRFKVLLEQLLVLVIECFILSSMILDLVL